MELSKKPLKLSAAEGDFGKDKFFIPGGGSYYPSAYRKAKRLSICSKCFAYFNKKKKFLEHINACKLLPGKLIYEHAENDDKYEFYEVDGAQEYNFCINLCLFAKIWLESKDLDDGIEKLETFYYYLLAIRKVRGDHEIVGYFSKNKDFYTDSEFSLHLGSIVVFQQGCGYGTWLVDLSHKLSMVQRKPGVPETPYSYEGKKLYIK